MGTIAHVSLDVVDELAKGATRVGVWETASGADAQAETIASTTNDKATTTLRGDDDETAVL
jgi:hypothetical protein